MKVPRRVRTTTWAAAMMLALCSAAFPLAPTAQADVVGLPVVTGPIPITADTRPFRDRIGPPLIAMDEAGYVEEEFFVGGHANVYEWGADAQAVVRTSDAPYETRIIVRRPAKPNKFSGTVWVEPLNPTLGFDLDRMWQLQYEQILRDGDAYVGVTIKPNAILALQTFDPARYGSLSMANPLPPEEQACGLLPGQPGYNPNTSRLYENGLAWDIISQVGAVLKSDLPSNPLVTPASKVFGTGWSQTGGYALRYFSTFGSSARLGNGDPVYDGWLTGGATGPTAINQCQPVPAATDARNQIRPSGVPVISVRVQGDFFSFAYRRPDGDDPDDMYRLYELAGPSHDTATIFENFAPDEDIVRAGGVPPDPDVCGYEFVTDFPYEYYFNAASVNLKLWTEGIVPPYGARYEYAGNQIVLDEFGNAVGGVRSPYLDVPIATYNAGTSGPFTCLVLGYRAPFSEEQLDDLYANHGDYVHRVTSVTKDLVRERFLLREDASDIVSEAAHASVP